LSVKGARELFCFTRAFSFAKDTVTLLYTRRSSDMSPILPSEVIGRIISLTRERVRAISIDSLPISERLYSPSMSYELLDEANEHERSEIFKALEASGEDSILTISKASISNDTLSLGADALAIIYKGDLYLSQSRLETYLKCPMSYFLKYNLKLEEKEPAELSSSVIGSFIHAILEDFFREIRDRRIDISSLTDDDKDRVTERASRRYINEHLLGGHANERTKVAISRLCRAARPVIDGVCDEFSQCRYVPALFELSTDGRKKTDAQPIVYEDEGGDRIIIRGKVDRVDTYSHGDDVYVRVVDYKTGAKEFSPSDIKDGINMQMFLYLKSIIDTKNPEFLEMLGASQDGKLIPGGVIYTKTSIKDAVVHRSDDSEAASAAKEQSGREGMILDDEISIEAMNPRFTPLKYPETNRNAKSNRQKKYTLDEWQQICDSMKDAVLEISGRMRSGDISASPREVKGTNPCDWCSFKSICRSAKV
jgi:ATP-dependent helicase/nuclease subunit B